MAKQLKVGRRDAITGMSQGVQPVVQSAFFPAPTGGLNRTDSLGALPPTDCYSLINMVVNSQGVGARAGFTNHVTLIGNSIDTEVKTIAAFNDVDRDATLGRSRMFAFTNQGIYDVTNVGTNPTLLTIYDGLGSATPIAGSPGWLTKGGDAGWCKTLNFTTAALTNGKHYLLACDLINGYHVYDPDGGGANVGRWYQVELGVSGQKLEGIDPKLLAHVMSWKGRLIFTERSSSRAWYLTPGTITGTGAAKPVALDMGSRFNFGGFLKGCFSWTYDGGAGIDDFLVVISSAGDVVVWQGIAPGDASFQIRGVWYVGDVPFGRRIADDFGGDLLIYGSLGVIPVSALVEGGRVGEEKYITYKIQELVRRYFRVFGEEWGWNLNMIPAFGGYVLTLPPVADNEYEGLYFSTTTNAWSQITGVPAIDWAEFKGKQYFSTWDGRICQLGGSIDTIQISAGVFSNDPISWRIITSFQPFEQPAIIKCVSMFRPVFLTEQLPVYSIEARYDFNVTPALAVDPPAVIAGARWDIALWDSSYWGGQFITDQPLIGTAGMGRWVGIAMEGRSSYPTNIVGWNAIYTSGGML